ncbi:hypothetical protein FKW77_008227 [Venturia effusa]|uniref:Uncharacterized protein n=1 Tax=Venturia effusa TaxID=50376 RepID=A0A517L5V7_9PEZI|nr:hypothetical protein FKW77_008227 [Venturia effusa]
MPDNVMDKEMQLNQASRPGDNKSFARVANGHEAAGKSHIQNSICKLGGDVDISMDQPRQQEYNHGRETDATKEAKEIYAVTTSQEAESPLEVQVAHPSHETCSNRPRPATTKEPTASRTTITKPSLPRQQEGKAKPIPTGVANSGPVTSGTAATPLPCGESTMSRMPGGQRSTAKKEMEALASQLARLRNKIAEIEERIFELATLYCRLPLCLRKGDGRLKESSQELLESCFSDAAEEEQWGFWVGKVQEAKWIVVWIERARKWGEGFGTMLDVGIARTAMEVVSEGLTQADGQCRKIRYELLGFSEDERSTARFVEQSEEGREECWQGAFRFLYFWPGTEGWIQRGFTGVEKLQERDLPSETARFLGLGDDGTTTVIERPDEVEGKAEVETSRTGSFDEGDSGVFFTGRESVDSRAMSESV